MGSIWRRAGMLCVSGILCLTACSPGATKPGDERATSADVFDNFPEPELSAPAIPDLPPRGVEHQRCGDLPYPGMGAMQAHDCWIVTMHTGNSIDAFFAGGNGEHYEDPAVGLLVASRDDDVVKRSDTLEVPGHHGDVTLIGVTLDLACFVSADGARGAFSTLTWQFLEPRRVEEACSGELAGLA